PSCFLPTCSTNFCVLGFGSNAAEKSRKKSAKKVTSKPNNARSLLIQARDNFGVAHIGPFADQLKRLDLFSGLGKLANGISQFVLAPRRRFQFCGKIKNASTKSVKIGVVPGNSVLGGSIPPV